MSTHQGDVIYLEAVRWPVVLLDRDQCSISYFLASLRAQENTSIRHQCFDQLTAVKTGYPLTSITWPYRGLKCRPIEVEYFFEVQMIAASFFCQWFISNMLCLCHYGPALLGLWFLTDLGRDNSVSFFSAKRAWERALCSWNMVNLFSFGCHVTDRAYVRTYVRVYRLYG